MTILEAAQRLGLHEWHVLRVDEHTAGHIATLRDGTVMLMSETVARVYVPDVDDVQEPAEPETAVMKPVKKTAKKSS